MVRWKTDWNESRQRIIDWWDGKGFIIGTWGGVRLSRPHADLPQPAKPASLLQQWTDIPWRIEQSRRSAAWTGYPLETLPVADPWFGPGSMAMYLGCEPGWQEETAWYHSCISDPDTLPPIRLDKSNPWWRTQLELIRGMVQVAGDDYFIGMPDMVENWDVLASMRDAQTLLMDMIERPDWVKQRIDEVTDAFFNAYDGIYDLLKHQDGVCNWFRTWAPGKVAKVQCDGSSMFSPEMFREFVVPALKRQCQWLDYSLYHLDGSQCICHLDALLEIEALDAIEWTPDPKVPSGGSPHWYEMYRRILKAGKRVQVLGATPEQIEPLLDAVGSEGVYFLCLFNSEEEAECYQKVVQRLR